MVKNTTERYNMAAGLPCCNLAKNSGEKKLEKIYAFHSF